MMASKLPNKIPDNVPPEVRKFLEQLQKLAKEADKCDDPDCDCHKDDVDDDDDDGEQKPPPPPLPDKLYMNHYRHCQFEWEDISGEHGREEVCTMCNENIRPFKTEEL